MVGTSKEGPMMRSLLATCALIAVAAPCLADTAPVGRPVEARRGLGQASTAAADSTSAGLDYSTRIAEAQRCIDFSQKTIAAEHEIGRTVGYVNKASLYQAGRNLVICRQDLKRYKAEAAQH